MTNIYNLFKFLEDKEGKPIPFKYKLIYRPETLTPKELNVRDDLDLYNTSITSLPAGLEVGGTLWLNDTPITSLPADLKVGGYLDLRSTKITTLPVGLEVGANLWLNVTPIAKKYTEQQIRKMVPGVKGLIY